MAAARVTRDRKRNKNHVVVNRGIVVGTAALSVWIMVRRNSLEDSVVHYLYVLIQNWYIFAYKLVTYRKMYD